MKVKFQHMSTAGLLISDRFQDLTAFYLAPDTLHRESFITRSDSVNVDAQKLNIPLCVLEGAFQIVTLMMISLCTRICLIEAGLSCS